MWIPSVIEDFNSCKFHTKIPFLPHREQILSPHKDQSVNVTTSAECKKGTKHVHTLCGQNAELWKVTAASTHS